MEIAEEALQTFHLACNAIKFARSPLVFGGEKETIQDADQATRGNFDKRSYSAQLRRLSNKDDVFSRLQTLRTLCNLYFEGNPDSPFEKVLEVRSSFVFDARALIRHKDPIPQKLRDKWEDTIYQEKEDDPIGKKLTEAMDEIQTVCGPYLKPQGPTPRTGHWWLW